MEVVIVYEDKVLIVVNKFVGIVVYGGSGVSVGVIEVFCQLCFDVKDIELVYCFDCDIFGLLMIVKKCSMLCYLYEVLWGEKIVDKCYYVLVCGYWLVGKKNVCVLLLKNNLCLGE